MNVTVRTWIHDAVLIESFLIIHNNKKMQIRKHSRSAPLKRRNLRFAQQLSPPPSDCCFIYQINSRCNSSMLTANPFRNNCSSAGSIVAFICAPVMKEYFFVSPNVFGRDQLGKWGIRSKSNDHICTFTS